MLRFLQFPENTEAVGRALAAIPRFNSYPWYNYENGSEKWDLNFNGEDIALSIDWFDVSFFGVREPKVRLQVGHRQKRNPIPRQKGQRRKDYRIWIPSRYFDRYFAWDKVPETLPKVLLTTFNKADRERLNAAYAMVAQAFSPAVEHHELHTDVGGYDESGLSFLVAKEEKLLVEMNGEGWYPAEYPPENLARAVEAAKRSPGLRVIYQPITPPHIEFKAGVREFDVVFFLDTEKHRISQIFLQLSNDEIGVDPLGYAGNGVPGTFEEFLVEALDDAEDDEWADDPDGFVDEIQNPVRRLKQRYGKLFSDFYDTFLRTLHNPVEHHELHTDIGPYDECRLTESEEVSDARWQEIIRWVEEEWEGGGWPLERGDYVLIYALQGVMSLRFETYKHKPEDPRVLYSIRLGLPSVRDFCAVIFNEGVPVPETLDDFVTFYAQTHGTAFLGNVKGMRAFRRRIKEIKIDPGYPSLAEVYEYVISRLRTPPEHHELHTDVGGYEEGHLNYAGSSLNEAPMKKSKKSEEKLLRTLAIFLRFVKAFDPNFRDWANLEEVWITADNPVWKTGGGGILKVASDVNAYFPLTVSTEYTRDLPSMLSAGYERNIVREINVKRVLTDPYKANRIVNAREASVWTGPVFLVQFNANRDELTRTLRFRFKEPHTVPSVESLAGVHSFKTISPGQLGDVEIFARTAEREGLDNPVGRAAAIRQGTMGYADPRREILFFDLEKPEFKVALERALEDFMQLWAIPEHYELHTDTGAYEEAVSPTPSVTSVIAIPEDTELLRLAGEEWSRYPHSKLEKGASANCFLFDRDILLSWKSYKIHISVYPGWPINILLSPGSLSLRFPDWNAIPDDPEYFYRAFLKACREGSDAFARLKAVKPATAAHWQKQFLLGINLEKKVPEEAFPSAPVAALPAYFDKFRATLAAPVIESDLRLVIDADLNLLGE